MNRLLISLAATCVAGRPDRASGFGGSGGQSGGSSFGGGVFNPMPSGSYGAPTGRGCAAGEVQRMDGSCVMPIVTRNLYLYNAPEQEAPRYGPPPTMPDPKIHYNFVFLKTPEQAESLQPIVAPPPKQKTLVYVLSKKPDAQNQEVIEVPVTPTKPEVFYVAYGEGENPQLPGGVDLRTALQQSMKRDGQVVNSGGGNNAGGDGGYNSPGGSAGGSGGGSVGGSYSSPGASTGGSGGGGGGGYSSPGGSIADSSSITNNFINPSGAGSGFSNGNFGSSGGSSFDGSSGGGSSGGGSRGSRYSGGQGRGSATFSSPSSSSGYQK